MPSLCAVPTSFASAIGSFFLDESLEAATIALLGRTNVVRRARARSLACWLTEATGVTLAKGGDPSV
jgi:hypothetical protein